MVHLSHYHNQSFHQTEAYVFLLFAGRLSSTIKSASNYASIMFAFFAKFIVIFKQFQNPCLETDYVSGLARCQ